ncbi:MAG: dihydroneopterin aldolase [Bacteroidales bacterium]|nr:dihydroneopterin aldolase [Bacteroidales bacterium]
MGRISINRLRLLSHHGVMEQERRVGNIFEVSLTMDVPATERAMATDDLTDTINYAAVTELIKREMAHPCKLIEAAAGRIILALRAEYPGQISHGTVSVSKMAPPIPMEMESVTYTADFNT